MFRLRAKNEHGWGPYSVETASIPSNVPDQMNSVSTVVDNTYIKVSWTAPDENGATITNYRILLLAADSLTWLESEFCKSTDASLVTAMYCYVPMAELTGSRFNLPYNRLISVKAQAKNLRGWGELSQSNIVGAKAEIVPS